MDDNKLNRDILKVFATEATPATVINKLAALEIDCEDPRLKNALAKLVHAMRTEWAGAGTKVKVTPSVYSSVFADAQGSRQQLAKGIGAMKEYIEKLIASRDPNWQIIARAAGWTPPTSP